MSPAFANWLAVRPTYKAAWDFLAEQRRDEGMYGDASAKAARVLRHWAQTTPRGDRLAVVPAPVPGESLA